MGHHEWGDEDFDWNLLYKVHSEILQDVKTRTGCTVVSKEKYGSLRFEAVIPPYGAYCFIRNKLQGYWIDTWLYRKWQGWGTRVLAEVCLTAARDYPTLRSEILSDIASNEHLVGKEIHDEFWTSV